MSLDFADPESSRVLAQAVFSTEYGLQVELPRGHLIPTIPNRVDYLLWIEDLLRYAREAGMPPEDSGVKGIDVGTGPSCVFPLLGAKMHPDWHFVATDVDEASCKIATENVRGNELEDRITVVHNRDPLTILAAATSDPKSHFTFAMTNPPFYDGPEDLDACRQLKSNAPPESPEYTASEYFFTGGELSFISIMFEESLRLRDRILWYTSVVAKKSNLKPLRKLIKGHVDVKSFHWTRWIQGSTSRWAIAWSYNAIPIDPADRMDKKARKKAKQCDWHQVIELKAPAGLLLDKIAEELSSCQIETEIEGQLLTCTVQQNTWCRRSRRGHAPPEARFDLKIALKEGIMAFRLPVDFASQADAFCSLVSHLQKKFILTKR